MPRYTTALFDLDGTLTDSAPGLINSISYALDKLGVPPYDREALRKYIGPPLEDSFQKFNGLSFEDSVRGLGYFREYFEVTGLFENSVYDGIPALLGRLSAAGVTLAVATSKPELFARRITDHFGLTPFFAYVGGANMDETRTDKAEVIECVLGELGVSDKSAVIMAGDREHDVFGARKAGLDCVGVLFGYGDRAELEAAGARYIADTPRDVGDIILGE